jgi:phosphoribosylaminoimidazole-succinocarboxamide synthase
MIIADTKFEFGLDEQGTLVLMDEVLTPDSSRYWPVEGYEAALPAGQNPPSYDKQFVRDWLEQVRSTASPGTRRRRRRACRKDVVEKTAAKYREALERLTAEVGGAQDSTTLDNRGGTSPPSDRPAGSGRRPPWASAAR